jgi:hypothetical protein
MLCALRPLGHLGALATALSVWAACASAQSAGSGSAPPASPAPPAASQNAAPDSTHPAWLVADEGAKTATIALVVTPAASGSALINGRRAGDLQLIVPLNWTVQWDWRSADSTAPHSLVVMEEREKLPTEGGRPVFTNAMTRSVTAGLPAGQVDRTTFTAEQAGWYWLLCGVPGHALAGEYIGLRVDPDAKTASVKLK